MAYFSGNAIDAGHLIKPPGILKKQTIIFSGLLLIGLLFEWWLLDFSGLNIPEHIPYTPINVSGFLLLVLLLTILIVFIKKLVRQDSSFSIFRLTLTGAIACFIAEFVFQFIKLLVENGNLLKGRLIDFCAGVIGIAFLSTVLSFFVSYQVKTRKTGILLLLIILFMAFIGFISTLMPYH
ncbi:MAG: hypothetical protein KIT80_02955 [Chitinophagaceae bacterium]|nr:hypothetical protein [Chitinophagaceae bacterium]MCW5925844.1 hypothetical protein [Chitinophagaceae bacterium]